MAKALAAQCALLFTLLAAVCVSAQVNPLGESVPAQYAYLAAEDSAQLKVA